IDNARLRNILNNIYENMLGGKTFSEALSDFSDVFDEVYRGLVKVGEQTGQLEKILAELTSMLKWQDELSAKAKKIMIYPAIVGMVVGGVTIFMMTVVVPQIVGFVKDMGGELPLQTQALLATSEFIVNDWYWLIIVPGAFVMTYKYLRKTNPNFVVASDKFFLHLKPFGPIFFRIKLARMANTMAVMYAAGVGLRDILETTGRIVSNAYLQQQIQGIYSQIEQGQSLYSAFEQTQTFPKLFNKLIKVGENSGKLDEALRNLSYIYDREAKEAIDKIEPAIEPAITLFLAIIIGWVLMSVLGPIWDSLGKMT
ncbi:MAG: type II secretion system F family protein, partial [Moraxella osloensis]|nr:type II secretion system F family protein [Moraxella osloensis]